MDGSSGCPSHACSFPAPLPPGAKLCSPRPSASPTDVAKTSLVLDWGHPCKSRPGAPGEAHPTARPPLGTESPLPRSPRRLTKGLLNRPLSLLLMKPCVDAGWEEVGRTQCLFTDEVIETRETAPLYLQLGRGRGQAYSSPPWRGWPGDWAGELGRCPLDLTRPVMRSRAPSPPTPHRLTCLQGDGSLHPAPEKRPGQGREGTRPFQIHHPHASPLHHPHLLSSQVWWFQGGAPSTLRCSVGLPFGGTCAGLLLFHRGSGPR